MRKRVGMIASIICSLAVSVAAYAVPLDKSEFNLMIPQIITAKALDPIKTEMTYVDFIASAHYEMVINTIEQVPIVNEAVVAMNVKSIQTISKVAVIQNSNFERQVS